MRILALSLLVVSPVVFAKTQKIICVEPGSFAKITLELNRANQIISGDSEIGGEGLTPQLYEGQSFSDEFSGTEALTVTAGQITIDADSWDPSSDNPTWYKTTFPKSILGKSLKKGKFSVVVDGDATPYANYKFDKKGCFTYTR
jgi:hypothetical protein